MYLWIFISFFFFLIAIVLAIQWVEEVKPTKVVICSDSLSALNGIISEKSTSRNYLIYEVLIHNV